MDDAKQTLRVWEADLGEDRRKLTLEELRTLETMHACQQLSRLVVALEAAALHLSSLEGRFDRLETFLAAADGRYPRSPSPDVSALPPGRRP